MVSKVGEEVIVLGAEVVVFANERLDEPVTDRTV